MAEADGASSAPIISADRRFVAFSSFATNLVTGGVDTNGQTDVFVYDMTTGDVFRPNISTTGAQATRGESFAPAISEHGRFIAFESDATNLVPDDLTGLSDIFLRDRGLCVGDLNGDGEVGAVDLAMLLAAWGPWAPPWAPCPPVHPADLDMDCEVGAGDLAMLLAAWGPCSQPGS